ncbi:MAG: methyltransferase domain-containing protein [Bauldia sp.]
MAGVRGKLDIVGDGIGAADARWSFDLPPESFTEHVRKSIPLYDEGHDLVCRYSDYFVGTGSIVYDIGTSTGILANKLADWHAGKRDVRIVGIDVVPSMIEYCQSRYASQANLQFVCADLVSHDFEPASLFTSYYVIQFVPTQVRQNLIDRIFQRLNWGGGFLMFEKVRAPDARFQDYATQIYADYKLEHGYDAQEIVAKTRSLKGVLEPFSSNANVEMLQRAGFKDIMTIQKWACFEGILAIK